MARIVVRGQWTEVPDHLAGALAGLGAESYLRLEQMWLADQRAQYEQSRQQPAQQQQQTAPRRVAPRAAEDQQAEELANRRAAIEQMMKDRAQIND
jgi:hypothetical protein